MKKVMIISNTVGVIYKFKLELLEELKKLGYEVYLLAQNENEDSFLDEIKKIGVQYLEVPMSRRGMNPLKDFKLLLSYIKVMNSIRPDFIYTFTIKPNLYGGLASKILKVKYAVTVTGIGTLFQKDSIILKIVKKLYKISLSSAQGIFFENSENQKYFVEQEIIREDKTILVPGSGVNLKKFYPMKKDRQDNKIVFLFIGRIMKEKGIEEFLYTAEKISEEYKNSEFWILGNYEEENYKKGIENLQKKGYVKYLGVTDDVRKFIKECDYLIQPSYHEGMSNVILEASAMGKLVIASDIPGCREAIYDKKYLFESKNSQELKNKIEEIIKSFENEKEDKEKQTEFISEKFDRNYIIKNQINLIKEREN